MAGDSERSPCVFLLGAVFIFSALNVVFAVSGKLLLSCLSASVSWPSWPVLFGVSSSGGVIATAGFLICVRDDEEQATAAGIISLKQLMDSNHQWRRLFAAALSLTIGFLLATVAVLKNNDKRSCLFLAWLIPFFCVCGLAVLSLRCKNLCAKKPRGGGHDPLLFSVEQEDDVTVCGANEKKEEHVEQGLIDSPDHFAGQKYGGAPCTPPK
jgi:hypothetical protein